MDLQGDLMDYSSVRLVAHTVPTLEELDGFNLAEFIAFCAKVSNPASQANTLTMAKLLKYLEKHKHWSPFEMGNMVLEIKTTRDIARQILRHRSFSFQEFSQRYADPNSQDSLFALRELRFQDNVNRQNSIEADLTNDAVASLNVEWFQRQTDLLVLAKQNYDWAIENGIAKEQARAFLPEGNTMSTLYVNGTIRSWMHYADLRSDNGTQKEHILIAEKVEKILQEVMLDTESMLAKADELNIYMGNKS